MTVFIMIVRVSIGIVYSKVCGYQSFWPVIKWRYLLLDVLLELAISRAICHLPG